MLLDLRHHKLILNEASEEDSEIDDENTQSCILKNCRSIEEIKTIEIYEPMHTEPNKLLNTNSEIIKLDYEIKKKKEDKYNTEKKNMDTPQDPTFKKSKFKLNIGTTGIIEDFKSKTQSSKLISSVIIKKPKLVLVNENDASISNISASPYPYQDSTPKGHTTLTTTDDKFDKISLENFRNKNNKLFVSSKHQPIVINMKDLLAENSSNELNKFNTLIGTGGAQGLPNIKQYNERKSVKDLITVSIDDGGIVKRNSISNHIFVLINYVLYIEPQINTNNNWNK